ncbi:MAG: PKD domain-containing protein [Pseudomonadota bacterium]
MSVCMVALLAGCGGGGGSSVTPTAPVNQAPTASLSSSAQSGRVDLGVDFDGTQSSDSDGNIASYSWDFDGDGAEDATASTASFTYTVPGTYIATLRVTDNDGATNDTSVTITVERAEEQVTFILGRPDGSNSIESQGDEGESAATLTATTSDIVATQAKSPDGTRLLYIQAAGQSSFSGQPILIDLETGIETPLPFANASQVRWSADSAFVAFNHDENPGSSEGIQVIVSDRDGTTPTAIEWSGANISNAQLDNWSADGQYLFVQLDFALSDDFGVGAFDTQSLGQPGTVLATLAKDASDSRSGLYRRSVSPTDPIVCYLDRFVFSNADGEAGLYIADAALPGMSTTKIADDALSSACHFSADGDKLRYAALDAGNLPEIREVDLGAPATYRVMLDIPDAAYLSGLQSSPLDPELVLFITRPDETGADDRIYFGRADETPTLIYEKETDDLRVSAFFLKSGQQVVINRTRADRTVDVFFYDVETGTVVSPTDGLDVEAGYRPVALLYGSSDDGERYIFRWTGVSSQNFLDSEIDDLYSIKTDGTDRIKLLELGDNSLRAPSY